jgi:transcriptional regulator with XRE-family HTH domain
MAGVSASHLSRIERGLAGAQPEILQRIARALGVVMEDIAWEIEGVE